jgi:microcystin-dependent protein
LRILLTGPLTFNIVIFIPANVPGMWIVDNKTSGAFTVTVKTNGPLVGTTVAPAQGYQTLIFSDGTNITYADLGSIINNVTNAVQPGMIFPYGGNTPPSGYLLCNGAAYSRSTYSALYTAIGTIWGTGDGSTTFNVPNFQGAFLRGAGTGLNPSARAVGSYEADDNKLHSHAVTDPGHKHTVNNVYTSDGADSNPYFTPNSWGTLNVPTTVEKTGITIADSGGAEARPKNFAVNYIIRT